MLCFFSYYITWVFISPHVNFKYVFKNGINYAAIQYTYKIQVLNLVIIFISELSKAELASVFSFFVFITFLVFSYSSILNCFNFKNIIICSVKFVDSNSKRIRRNRPRFYVCHICNKCIMSINKIYYRLFYLNYPTSEFCSIEIDCGLYDTMTPTMCEEFFFATVKVYNGSIN